jgi:hypothetical protein
MRPRRTRKFRSIGICAAIAVGASLGVIAPPAMAAPANDAFANRTDLGDQLPVHETESNVGATRESGEPTLGLIGAAGHSLWWSWEAPATEWVTVSTCQTPFPTVVGIFEGPELGHLTRVAEGNADEGPACLFQGGRTYTFKAQTGHRYAIGADGNGFYVPGQPGTPQPPPPIVEGEITLTIEATPRPSNDDFADATPIEEEVHEEPGGGRRFMVLTDGYNWNATKEPGEPDHAGDPGGASVWYSWTAPESGEATIGYGVGGPGLLAVYTGSALDELTPVASTSEWLAGVHIPVVGGTRYMIAVDGKRSEPGGEPALGAFALTVSEQLRPGPGYSTSAPSETCGSCGMGTPAPAVALPPAPEVRSDAARARRIKARKAREARRARLARARRRHRHHLRVVHREQRRAAREGA